MVFGIIVEAGRDAGVYSILIRRVRPDVNSILSRSCGGIVGLRRQFVAWLKSFQWHSDPVVAKALVICDSDCRGSESVQDELDRILDQSGFRPQLALPVHFYATRCEVENWLLADESAVNKVARDRGKAGKAEAVADNLEAVRNAKERFRHMLSQADLPATAQVYAEWLGRQTWILLLGDARTFNGLSTAYALAEFIQLLRFMRATVLSSALAPRPYPPPGNADCSVPHACPWT